MIATESGWNMYVGGNGGFSPRHAELLAADLDDEGLIRAIDRFFMYYIRTADRLQRTAGWCAELDGGLDGLREVIFDDSLGICDDLDAAMSVHVDRYEDEWAATLRDPVKLRRFESFVNATDTLTLLWPTFPSAVRCGRRRRRKRFDASVMIAGTTLEVRR